MIMATNKKKSTQLLDRSITAFLWIISGTIILLILWMLFWILRKGIWDIRWDFLLGTPEEFDEGGGIGPFLFNSFYVLSLAMIFSTPIGVGAGIYLAEYAPNNRFTNLIRICVEGLASVPSIVFGIFGMALFVEYFQIGLTILGASVSLALLNLPVLTRVTEESLRAVPSELREGAYALGATKAQCICSVILPTAWNNIITGIGLVAGRAFGESAVIILTAGTSSTGEMWDFNLFSPGATLAVHLWYVQSESIVMDAQEIADKSAAVLICFVLLINFCLRLPTWIQNRWYKINS